MESITCHHRQTKQKCFPSTPDTGQKSTASQKQRCNFRAVKQTLYLRRQIFNLRDFCLQMNKHTGHSKKVQHAQNGALFEVCVYFLNACIHIGKINTTKAFVLSNNSINIA